MFKRWQRYSADTWYREASKGKARFIFLRGVVGWGLPMFITMTFVLQAAGLADDCHPAQPVARVSRLG